MAMMQILSNPPRCECHECTQIRWKMSMMGQIQQQQQQLSIEQKMQQSQAQQNLQQNGGVYGSGPTKPTE